MNASPQGPSRRTTRAGRTSATPATKTSLSAVRAALPSWSPLQLAGAGLLVLVLVGTLTIPVRTYQEQKAELAQTELNIARMEQRIAELEQEKELYSDPAYIREQARLRLALVEPGETPFRIVDPGVGQQATPQESAESRVVPATPWYQSLWTAITFPEDFPDSPDTGEVERPDRGQLPTVTEQSE